MKTITGNLLDQKPGILCHQVNLYGIMGGGLAHQIREKWPAVYREYVKHCRIAPKVGDIQFIEAEPDVVVANLFAQSRLSRSNCTTVYGAYPPLLEAVRAEAELRRLPVYIPHGIGCGLAGGDWRIILPYLEKFIPNATIVKYAP